MKKIQILILSILTTTVYGQVEEKKNPVDFLPLGHVISEEIIGDLNEDGIDDCVLLIKGTDPGKIVINRFNEEVDRNRRGIIVLFNKNNLYELVVKNYACFYSENEDGGVYFPPELIISIEHEKLYFNYGHGRYGYWKYTFRFQNSDIELIGYDKGYRSSIEADYVTFDETSINFLSKKKIEKEVIKVTAEGREIFKETKSDIIVKEFIKLSEIKDFYDLDLNISE